MTQKYVLAIDQGTTSSRAIIFDHQGRIVATGQKEHEQIFPRAGWVEHNPAEIWDNVREVVGIALAQADVSRDHRRRRRHQPARDHHRVGQEDR
jgi:glycerol kinase